MQTSRAAAVAPRVAELAAAVADACSRDGVKDAQAAYGELKNLGEDAVPPPRSSTTCWRSTDDSSCPVPRRVSS